MSCFSQGYGINHFTERSLYLAHVLEGSARHGREGVRGSAVHIRVGHAAENGEMLVLGQLLLFPFLWILSLWERPALIHGYRSPLLNTQWKPGWRQPEPSLHSPR